MEIIENQSLKQFTSWKVGGAAEYFCSPQNLEELKEAQSWAKDKQVPLTILGDGSNVLVNDLGIKGLVIVLKNLNSFEVKTTGGRVQVSCEAGLAKFELMRIFLKHKLAPALFLSGLPGNVAGGVYMNAGVSEKRIPREFCEIVDEVEVLRPHGEVDKVLANQIQWSYRHSQGWQPGIIVRVKVSWPDEPESEIPLKVREANKLRLSKQPLDKPSCGSVFRNPQGDSAGRLIDSCGLKGFSVGGAQVSEKHANFIINTGEAKASDIEAVIQHVKDIVLKTHSIELQEEVVRL